METLVICENGQQFILKTGADAGPGNGIIFTGGTPGSALPKAISDEITSPAFWDFMDALRAAARPKTPDVKQ